MDNPSTQPLVSLPNPERIFARQLARELTGAELEQVGGGRMPAWTPMSSTVCCDIDASCDC